MPFDVNRIPEGLREAYRNNVCAVYVGAGASKGAGLPLWPELLESMIKKALAEHVIDRHKADQYRALLVNPAKYLMIASGLKDDLGRHFDEFIESTFISVKPRPNPTALHEALVALDKLQFVITTNYDTLIERAYKKADPDEEVSVCSFREVGETQRRLSKREFFILKAHGDAAKPGNGIVLTEADYREIIYRERGYQSLLSAMFTMFTVVFVGGSMTDPELLLLLNYIANAFTTTAGPVHYALMPDDQINAVESARWFKDFHVQVIPISKANDYAEVTDFITALRNV